MFTEKIQKLMSLGTEAAKLSETSLTDEPSFTITWHKDNTMELIFYSYALELEDGRGNHYIVSPSEKEIEEWLDHLILLAKRELVSLSRKESTGCN